MSKPCIVGKVLGSGGFAKVYEAQNAEGQYVALKKAHITKHIQNPILRHEACALFLLAGHPCIPSAYAWGRSQYFEYLSMDILGGSLTTLVKEHSRLNIRSTLWLVDQMLDVMEHTHARHIIHQDVKPDNFLFGLGGNAGRLYLIDWGLSRYYRHPRSLQHRPLQRDQKFIGTKNYATVNAHEGISLSRRDDLISLAYTIAYLLRGTLPWDTLLGGSAKHRETRMRIKKRTWTGVRLFRDFPQEFSLFLDYALHLAYDETPDYACWKRIFRDLYRRREQPSPFIFHWSSAGALKDLDDPLHGWIRPSRTACKPLKPTAAPVSAGQYILVQIQPSPTLEGPNNSCFDKSRWYDPSLTRADWKFPKRPVLVLDISWEHDHHVVVILPLLYMPHQLNADQANRYVRVQGQISQTGDRFVVPIPRWPFKFTYHAAPPNAIKLHVLPTQKPIHSRWSLDSHNLTRVRALISKPHSGAQSTEVTSLRRDLDKVADHGSFPVYGQLLPFDSVEEATLPAPGTIIREKSLSWSGPRGIVTELVRLSCRRKADDDWQQSDGHESQDDNSDDDDNFVPIHSWPAPHNVSAEDVFGDEGRFLRDKMMLIVSPPIMSKRDIYNDDERMLG